MNLVYLAESQEAVQSVIKRRHGPGSAWPSSADALWILKRTSGTQFIRDMGFDTSSADAVCGVDWLERA